jgi:hypothetical protein
MSDIVNAMRTVISLFVLPILCIGILYLINSAIRRKWVRIDWPIAVLYVIFIAAFGPFGEIIVGNFYHWVTGGELWHYLQFPIHQAYTSLYAPIIWGVAGFHFYMLHDTLREWGWSRRRIAWLFPFDILLVEIMINSLFLLLSGGYLFYYGPGELLHFSSLQTLPFYLFAGVVILLSMKRFEKDPWFFTLLCGSVGTVIIWLT